MDRNVRAARGAAVVKSVSRRDHEPCHLAGAHADCRIVKGAVLSHRRARPTTQHEWRAGDVRAINGHGKQKWPGLAQRPIPKPHGRRGAEEHRGL